MDTQVESPKKINELLQWGLSIITAVAVAMFIRAFIFEPVVVEGHSMDETLNDGQRLIEFKLGYKFSAPKRGDIVVVEIKEGSVKYLPIPDPDEVDYIKRVIGLPGDEINIKDGFVYVNGQKINEPYIKGKTYTKDVTFPLKVKENEVFVLGDNRERSSDSRESQVGCINIAKVRGKAVLRIWPLNKIDFLE